MIWYVYCQLLCNYCVNVNAPNHTGDFYSRISHPQAQAKTGYVPATAAMAECALKHYFVAVSYGNSNQLMKIWHIWTGSLERVVGKLRFGIRYSYVFFIFRNICISEM